MTERDAFEDILNQFRPVGPRQGMPPPAGLFEDTSSSPENRLPRTWIAGSLLFVAAAAAGTVWMWERRISSPEAELTTPAGIAAAPERPGAIALQDRNNPIVVGGDVKEPELLRRVMPVYSSEPEPGIVAILRLTIDPAGQVDAVTILRGQGAFAAEAAEAVSQWQYESLVLNGEAVWCLMTVVVRHPF